MSIRWLGDEAHPLPRQFDTAPESEAILVRIPIAHRLQAAWRIVTTHEFVVADNASIYAQLINSIGGAEEDRTPDLRVANATLSQLSYGPTRSK